MKTQIPVNDNGRVIGESHPRAKYSDGTIDLLFDLVGCGLTSAQIARSLNMPIDTVKKIRCGHRRNHTVAGHRVVHMED